jgi:hypothetical protein
MLEYCFKQQDLATTASTEGCMSFKRISIVSPTKGIRVWSDVEVGREADHGICKTKVRISPASCKTRYRLEVKIPKVRQQMIQGSPCSLLVGVWFSPAGLEISLLNSASSPEKRVAFDPYTNRYPEYPARFTLQIPDMKTDSYGVQYATDYRGDFLVLGNRVERSRMRIPFMEFGQTFGINLSALFMFESLNICSDGKVFYKDHLIKTFDFQPWCWEIGFPRGEDPRRGIDHFMTESWKHAFCWLPQMAVIQACEEVNSDRDGVPNKQRVVEQFRKLLAKLE